MSITANATINGHEITNIPVINPGGWFGKTWLLEIGGSMEAHYLIVEADSVCSAIDELADSDTHAHHIVVDEEYLDDYDPETCHYGPSGQVLDLDHLLIHGDEGRTIPFMCRYFGGNLPSEGVVPTELDEWDWEGSDAEIDSYSA